MGDAQDTRFWRVLDKNAYVNEKLKEARYRWELRQAELLEWMISDKPGKVITFERIEYLPIPQPAPGCKMCGRNAWILVDHPISNERVCMECSKLGAPGWVACPATHQPTNACPLCRSTPGFIEEV